MSISPNIQNGLLELFKHAKSLTFAKKNYDELFKDALKQYRPLFLEITAACTDAEDSILVINEIAAILPDMFHKNLNLEESKRKKETLIMDYNTPMVTYVIPLLRYSRCAFTEDIVDEMVEKWNQNISMKIKKATYEEIHGGFKYKLCYITTAVCEHLNKADDCYELSVLRNYRDDYLMTTASGQELVETYYDIAPTIVKRINATPNADAIYRNIYEQYLSPCIRSLEMEDRVTCQKQYEEMVNSLQNTYVYERTNHNEH